MSDRFRRVWAMVKKIPRGRVATYGQIAALTDLGGRSAARQVGYALSALPDDTRVPWHRVVNASGKISTRSDPDRPEYQRILLEAEGIEFMLGGVIDLGIYLWQPVKKTRERAN